MSDLAVSRAAHSAPTKGRPKAYHALKPPSLSFATAVVQSGLNYILLILGSGAFLLPFYFIVNGSLKSNEAVQAGEIIRPPNEWSQILSSQTITFFDHASPAGVGQRPS